MQDNRWSKRDDDRAWAEMVRKQQARNAEQEAVRARRYADTAELAGEALSAGHIVPAVIGALGDDDALKAKQAIKRMGGPLGPAFSVTGAYHGYRADRARHEPFDEAAIRNYGGLALGTVGGLAAGALGSGMALHKGKLKAALAAGEIAGYLGAKGGEQLAREAADGWRDLKAAGRTFNRQIRTLNDPRYWVNRREER